MEARVLNDSNSENIYVAFQNPEDANTPAAPRSPIPPGSTAKRAVSSATMNLFVWTDPSASPIWTGIVPTKVQKVLEISPEKREVRYDGVLLPPGFFPVTDPTLAQQRASWGWGSYMLAIILVVALALIFFFIWKK